MSLDQNTKNELLKVAQERKEREKQLQATLTQQTAPVVPAPENTTSQSAPVVTPPVVEAVLPTEGGTPVPDKEKPKEEPTIIPPQVEEPVKAWDADDTVTEPVKSESFDYKKFSSALGLDVKDETELIQKTTESFTKLKQLEADKNSVLEGVPESLKTAIDIAKKGGDWKSATGNDIDVSTLDPLDLFDNDYERRFGFKYKGPDGVLDRKKMEDDIDALPEVMRSMQGEAIRQNIANMQAQKRMNLLAEAEKKQLEFTRNLADATRNVAKLLPKETFGITLEAKHSDYLFQGISNQSLVKKHLGDLPVEVLNKIEPSKLTKAIALLEYGDKIAKYQYSQGQVAAKKEVLSKTQNVQLNTGGLPAAPELTDAEKPKTAYQKLEDMKKRHMTQGSL